MRAAEFQLLDEFDYHHRLANTAGTALVLFSSSACGTCRMTEIRLPNLIEDGESLFRVDAQRSPALTNAFDIFHLPSLLLYRDGHFHARLNCQLIPVIFRRALHAALDRPAEEEP